MDLNEYKRIIRLTLKSTYPQYLLPGFFKLLEKKGLIKYDGRKKDIPNVVSIANEISDERKIDVLMDQIASIVREYEEYEYIRGYRYSYLFNITDFNLNSFHEELKKSELRKIDDESDSSDELKSALYSPTYYENEEKIYFKFNLRIFNKIDGVKSIKYPVLAIIHKDYGLIEIRQDVIPIEYKNQQKFYEFNARAVQTFIQNKFKIHLVNVDLQAVIRYMNNKKKEEVKVTAMRLKRDGMDAYLDSSENDKMKLPFIDELKDMLKEGIFNSSLKEVSLIKERLEEFIREVEENSNLPTARIFWIDNKYRVLARGQEVEGELVYIKWIQGLKGEEDMDYVARYINKCERELEKELSD